MVNRSPDEDVVTVIKGKPPPLSTALEYRIIDPGLARCCSYTPDLTAFLVVCADLRGCVPIACLHISHPPPKNLEYSKPHISNNPEEAKAIQSFFTYFNSTMGCDSYLIKTPPSHRYYDPRRTWWRNCKPTKYALKLPFLPLAKTLPVGCPNITNIAAASTATLMAAFILTHFV